MAKTKTQKKGGSGKKRRERSSTQTFPDELASSKKRVQKHEDPSRFMTTARGETSGIEIGAPLSASCSDIASIRINTAIDIETIVINRALRKAGENEKKAGEAAERFAELARSKFPDQLMTPRFESDTSDSEQDEEEQNLKEALKAQLNSEDEARNELQRISAQVQNWKQALIDDLGLKDLDDDAISADVPSPTAIVNAADASVREALDLKLIAASRLSDRAGTLRRALVSATAARTRLFAAYEATDSKRDARRIIRPDSPRLPRGAGSLAPRKQQYKKDKKSSQALPSSSSSKKRTRQRPQYDDDDDDDEERGASSV